MWRRVKSCYVSVIRFADTMRFEMRLYLCNFLHKLLQMSAWCTGNTKYEGSCIDVRILQERSKPDAWLRKRYSSTERCGEGIAFMRDAENE